MFAVLLGLLSCALLWLAAPAGAVVTEVSGTSVGLQPRAIAMAGGAFADNIVALARPCQGPAVHGRGVERWLVAIGVDVFRENPAQGLV